MEELAPVLAIVSLFIVLPGMIFHYLTKSKEIAAKAAGDPAMNARLIEIAERLERRIDAIETLLDAESPGWKKAHDRRHA